MYLIFTTHLYYIFIAGPILAYTCKVSDGSSGGTEYELITDSYVMA